GFLPPNVPEQFLDIRIDPYPYGTHSFRRGGCQWLRYILPLGLDSNLPLGRL
ncbi:hypothetical protein B0H14DRAFT_2823873, partial [Mycena olivaceomarginata]